MRVSGGLSDEVGAAGPSSGPGERVSLRQAWAKRAGVASVMVEEARVSYRHWGLDQSRRPMLFLVHGFMAHARWWDHIAPCFADRFRVVAPDFTGMGDSDRRAEYCRRQYARELIAVARETGAAGATLVAHSFGAVAALYAALIAPELFARVIILDARVFHARADRKALERPERSYATLSEGLTRFRLVPDDGRPDPLLLRYIARHSLRRNDNGGWRWKFDPETVGSAVRLDLLDELDQVSFPIDGIFAAESALTSLEAIATLKRKFPSCGEPVILPRSGHHLMLDQPAALVAALADLLAERR